MLLIVLVYVVSIWYSVDAYYKNKKKIIDQAYRHFTTHHGITSLRTSQAVGTFFRSISNTYSLWPKILVKLSEIMKPHRTSSCTNATTTLSLSLSLSVPKFSLFFIIIIILPKKQLSKNYCWYNLLCTISFFVSSRTTFNSFNSNFRFIKILIDLNIFIIVVLEEIPSSNK